MKLDVCGDMDHLFMVNFSAPAAQLERLVPRPMRLLIRKGRGYPSIILPRIRNLRPARLGIPRVGYELFGLRLLVEYDSIKLGTTRGAYFHRLILHPNHVRVPANLLSPFEFERGTIRKEALPDGSFDLLAVFASGEAGLSARVKAIEEYPRVLTEGTSFGTADEALAMYHGLAYGFLRGSAGATHVLQLAESNADYKSWPIRQLKVDMGSIRTASALSGCDLTLEPSYFVGSRPCNWRWLPAERRAQAVGSTPKVMVEGAA